MPDNNPTLMSGIFFVSANSRADCANSFRIARSSRALAKPSRVRGL